MPKTAAIMTDAMGVSGCIAEPHARRARWNTSQRARRLCQKRQRLVLNLIAGVKLVVLQQVQIVSKAEKHTVVMLPRTATATTAQDGYAEN